MAQETLTLSTFNVLNLQDVGKPMYAASDAPSQEVVDAKITWIATVIRMLSADVIGFQEVWSADLLERCFEEAGLSEQYDLAARDALGRGRPQVALAARKGWMQSFDWTADFPADFGVDEVKETRGAEERVTVSIRKFSRPVLRAVIRPDVGAGEDIAVFVAHLKSKAPTQLSGSTSFKEITSAAVSHIRRVMEAGALRAVLDAEMAATDDDATSPTIVMGDLNDGSLSVSTELLSSSPSYKLFFSDRSGGKSDKGLYSVETLQQYRSQMDAYYTYIYKNKFESLDHILVSEEFYDHSRKRQWSFKETRVFNDHLVYDKRDGDKSLVKADHGVVRAVFVRDPVDRAKSGDVLLKT